MKIQHQKDRTRSIIISQKGQSIILTAKGGRKDGEEVEIDALTHADIEKAMKKGMGYVKLHTFNVLWAKFK